MTDRDRVDERVRAWLREESVGEIPDWLLDTTLGRTRVERQRRPSGTSRPGHGVRSPGPRPGGRVYMFTVMRAAAIVALVAIGANLAFTGRPGSLGETSGPTQLVDSPSAEPVASPRAETTKPTAFTGAIVFGPCPVEATLEAEPGVIHRRGPHYCLPTVKEPFSDPRLQGTYYVWTTNDTYVGGGPEVWHTGFTIVNDEGSWRGVPQVTFGGVSTQVLVGDGAYSGLTAIADVTLEGETWSWNGWIIPGDVPPAPEPPDIAG